jgi:XTP/dITP diphosphohydrolase
VRTLIIATRNAHKADEIRQILGNAFDICMLTDFPGAPEVIEDADTFAGNATKKANSLVLWLQNMGNAFDIGTLKDLDAGIFDDNTAKKARSLALLLQKKLCAADCYVLADDSGLEVDALNGAPGVLSARFAAANNTVGNSSDFANNAKLLRILETTPIEKRTARFRCVLALASTNGADTVFFDGTCEGHIAAAPSGSDGFGYDPLFVPNGCDRSFAELGEEIKNKISHRARALEKMRQFFAEK